jgi:two-component system, cell cycle response regulator DivK
MTAPLILIVEDDPNSRKLLRDVLDAVGYATCETDSAEDGIRLALASAPALILMDIRLPGISGIEALRRLRDDSATRGIPVVAVTASVMPPQKMEATDAGFDAIEPKPVNVRALLATVRRLLEHNALPQAS